MKQNSIILLFFILVILGVWYMFSKSGQEINDIDLSQYGEEVKEEMSFPPMVPKEESKPINNNNINKTMNITLHTNKGDITLELFADRVPNTVANFAKLASEGFYNGVKFHRVIAGFMIQGGDPLSKDDSQMSAWGTGGPGYKFNDEITPDNKNDIGTISMANAGPNTNGSQFFINTANNNFLDSKHTVFGKVTSGMDVVEAIENTPVGANDRPVSPVIIERVTVK